MLMLVSIKDLDLPNLYALKFNVSLISDSLDESEIQSNINVEEIMPNNNSSMEEPNKNTNAANENSRCKRKIKKTSKINDEEWDEDDSYLCDFCDKRYLFSL